MSRLLFAALLCVLVPNAWFAENAACQEKGHILVDVKRKPSDSRWTPRETRTLELLRDFTPLSDLPETDAYGGLVGIQREATGFFRTEKIGGRWWIVDPEGHPCYNIGCCSVSMSPTTRGREALQATYGDEQAWASETVALLADNGFNSLGCWSDYERLRAARPIIYTPRLNLMSGFGGRLRITYQQPGHAGYPNDCIPVFHPDFPEYCRASAKSQIGSLKDDPWLLGYFIDNELPFRENALDRYMELPEDDYGRKAAEQWIADNHVRRGEAGYSTEDRLAFLEYVADAYFRITCEAIRAADPNHMVIGCRLHGASLRYEPVFRACGRYCDIVSVNYYGAWTPDRERLDSWLKWAGKPFLITEWYAKGMDSGMLNETGAGWTVRTQADRGRFYQNFTLALLENPGCVGWHWFKYMDNDPTSTSADPSNLNSNKGFLTNTYQPYSELLERMRALNEQAYPLIEHFDQRSE